MAKRQNNDTPSNVMRLDGEGKVHENGGGITPLCKFRGHGDHTWVTTDEAVDCGLCISRGAKRRAARERLEYAANARDTQDDVYSQGEPLADWERDALESASKGEPVTIPMAEVLKAVTPVVAENGEKVTVPVDYDDPTAGRRELDASKGERILSEDDMTSLLRKVRDRLKNEHPLDTDEWAEVVTQAVLDSHFAVTLYEPKNGPALDCEIPPLPAGVHPHTWELAHQGNTEGARAYHMRQAEAQEAEYVMTQEAEAHAKEYEHNEENGYDVMEADKPPF